MLASSGGTGSTYYSFGSYSGFRGGEETPGDRPLNGYIRTVLDNGSGGLTGSYAFDSYVGSESACRIPGDIDAYPSPRPFVHFIAKVASRCNIRCTYCYMYEHADQTWRTQPRFMSSETVHAMLGRVTEYLDERNPPETLVILHGGEPLLYGADRIRGLAGRIAELRERHPRIELAMQTNATLIDDELLDVLVDHRVHVGVSLDGPASVHDARRRGKRGGGTHEQTVRGLRRLLTATAHASPPAVTAVIDPETRPADLIDYFTGLGVTHADFQLPDLNHDTYDHAAWPPGTYGAWLIELYETLLTTAGDFRVRSIELLVRLLAGAPFGGDILGSRSFGTLVIDTDGTYHTHDALRADLDGVTATGMSVESDPIRTLETHPMVTAFTDKASAVAGACRSCPVFTVCGGGLVAHRYSTARGFDNPSVYCEDLTLLIDHVGRSLSQWRRIVTATRSGGTDGS